MKVLVIGVICLVGVCVGAGMAARRVLRRYTVVAFWFRDWRD
jgi:hypothetical protein